MLRPNGSIEFPEIFAETRREIHLTGEAFFDVAKDQSRPFIISTGDVTIKVLGTSFNVKAYQGAKEITVAVKTEKSRSTQKWFNPDQRMKEGLFA
jgi:ferric-dicitrate binding protein FerR (iron transport regulator)